MAEIGHLKIIDPGEGLVSGGSFRLDESPTEDHLIEVDGWEIETESSNPYIVARGADSITGEEIVGEAHERVQQGLDILSIQNDGDYTCENADSDRIVAWKDNGVQYLRLTSVVDVGMKSNVAVTVTDEDGNEAERTKPETEWHESMRYFRLSQNTDDLFDAYRNMFLALEHVLSDRTPQNAGEGESDWLKRALRDAHNSIDLKNYAPNDSAPVESFHGYQYENTRCRMFHAKTGKSRLLPHQVDDRNQVQDALSDLSRYYVDILKDTIQINRQSGVITHSGFELATSWMRDEYGMEVAFSDYNTPVQKSETLESNPWKQAIRFEAEYSEELSLPGLHSVLASLDPENVDLPKRIHRVGMVNPQEEVDGLMTSKSIEAGLEIAEVDLFQCQLGLRLRNLNSVRMRFPS